MTAALHARIAELTASNSETYALLVDAIARAAAAHWQAFGLAWAAIGARVELAHDADGYWADFHAANAQVESRRANDALARAATAEREATDLRAIRLAAMIWKQRGAVHRHDCHRTNWPSCTCGVGDLCEALPDYLDLDAAIDAARRATTCDACGTCGSPTCEGTHMKTDHEGHGKLCPFPSLPCCCRIAPAPDVSDGE